MSKIKETVQAVEEYDAGRGARPVPAKAVMHAGTLLYNTSKDDHDHIKASNEAMDANVFKRDLLGILVKYGDRPVKTMELTLGERYAVRRAWDENLMDLTDEGFSLTANGVKFIQSLGE